MAAKNSNLCFKGSFFVPSRKRLFGFFTLSLISLFVLGVVHVRTSPTPKHALFPPPTRSSLSPSLPYRKEAIIKLDQKEVIIKRQNDNCDLFKGHWVPDLKGSLYNNTNCLTIPDSKNCFKNGRKDVDFLNWRWKPDQCDLPRFDPFLFLRVVRGKRLAFVGDSVARNHMESLLCLLSQADSPIDMYKDKEDRFRTWNFPSSNFTLMMLWSQFLVKHDERLVNGSGSGNFNLHVDQVDQDWASKLKGIDYVVISDGHWFFRKNYLYKRNKLIGCVYCNEPKVKNLALNDALRMAFHGALSYIDNCNECGDVLTILRTFSPAHFENGSWDNGGNCNRTSPYGLDQMENIGRLEMELKSLQVKELKTLKKKRFVALDVTKAMLMRPDSHPGSFWGNKWMKGYNDCIHWCMPGPIDVWNDLLMAVLRREMDLV